jgi:hypothetical protein
VRTKITGDLDHDAASGPTVDQLSRRVKGNPA